MIGSTMEEADQEQHGTALLNVTRRAAGHFNHSGKAMKKLNSLSWCA